MKNHGIISIGGTAATALEDLYFFEKSARIQIELANTGEMIDDCVMSDKDAKAVYDYVILE